MTAVPSTFARRRTPLLTVLTLLAVLVLGAGHAVAKTTKTHRARHHAAPACAKAGRRSRTRTKCRTRARKASRTSARKTPAKTTKTPAKTTKTTKTAKPTTPKKTPAPVKTAPAPPTKTTQTKTTQTTTPTATTPSPVSPTAPLTTPIADLPATPFAPTSVWNQALPASAALDPQSTTYVSNLLSQIGSAGLWMNTYQYSTPVFTVPADQPNVAVKLDTPSSPQATALRTTWLEVPVPPTAKAAAGSDEHMVVYQPSTDRMWEFWKMTRQSDGWHAQWGGSMDNVSTNPGYFTSPGPSNWGATATSLPLLGGLIRPSELSAGHIDHAIALAIPNTRAQYFAWPAQRTDGNVYSATAIPEGQRFRLNPNLNLSTIPMSPMVRMIAVAAQKYGMIVRDKSGSVTVYGEDTTAEGLPNPYYGSTGWFRGQSVNNLLAAFPWADLQAVSDTMSCCWQKP
jgi:cytoskeletal protein RodZ